MSCPNIKDILFHLITNKIVYERDVLFFSIWTNKGDILEESLSNVHFIGFFIGVADNF
jgi:hypothetical protein